MIFHIERLSIQTTNISLISLSSIMSSSRKKDKYLRKVEAFQEMEVWNKGKTTRINQETALESTQFELINLSFICDRLLNKNRRDDTFMLLSIIEIV